MKIFLFALLVAAASAEYGNYYNEAPAEVAETTTRKYSAPADITYNTASDGSYSYSYKVADEETGEKHNAAVAGKDDTVRGEYTVEQPDGCTRKVTYVADENGYQPTVTYSGSCNPEAYMTPAIPADFIQTEKDNLAKVAADTAVVAAEYKAQVDAQMKIAAEHGAMKAEREEADRKKAEEEMRKSVQANAAAAAKEFAAPAYAAPAYAAPAYAAPAATAYAAPAATAYAAPATYEAPMVKAAPAAKAYSVPVVKVEAPAAKTYSAPATYSAPTVKAAPVVKVAPVAAQPLPMYVKQKYEAPRY